MTLKNSNERNKYKLCAWSGLAVMLVGGILMLVAAMLETHASEPLFLGLLLGGMGMFIGGTTLVCVGSVLERKSMKKRTAEKEATLAPNEFLLSPTETGVVTETGLQISRGDVFDELCETFPLPDVKLYRVCEFRKPKSKGKEQSYLVVNTHRTTEYDDEEMQYAYAVEERAASILKDHVEVLDHRTPSNPKRKVIQKFTQKDKKRVKRALIHIGIFLVLFAAAVCIGVWLNSSMESGAGVSGGIAGGVLAPFLLSGAVYFQRDKIIVYEDGIAFTASIGYGKMKTFLPFASIVRIQMIERGMLIDVGYGKCYYVKNSTHEQSAYLEACELLRKMIPEKFDREPQKECACEN